MRWTFNPNIPTDDSALFAVLVMHPLLPWDGTWSPGGDSVAYYATKLSLALILPISLPLLIFGLVFLWMDSRSESSSSSNDNTSMGRR